MRIIDLLTVGHPVAKVGVELIRRDLENKTDLPKPVIDAVVNRAPDAVAAISSIATNPNLIVTQVAPIRKSMEGWTAIFGGAIAVINAGAPLLGITPSGPLTEGVETVAVAIGAKPGIGTALVYLAFGGTYAFLYVRRRWFSRTITPEAANRAVAKGEAI